MADKRAGMADNSSKGAGPEGTAGAVARRVCLMLAGLLCLAAAACTTVYRNHGYVPEAVDLALVEVGVDTRETVAEKIGRPSAQGLLNDEGWFYVQSRFKHLGPRAARRDRPSGSGRDL